MRMGSACAFPADVSWAWLWSRPSNRLTLRDVDPKQDAALNAHIDGEFVPELLMSSGFLHCERYESGPLLPVTPGSDE
jgi:hypothetical protein